MSKGTNIALGTKAWVDRINAAWHRSLEGVLDLGRILMEAKEQLPHGSFTNMIHNELAFSARTAQRFMAIAGDERLFKSDKLSLLPNEGSILYALTRLSDEELERAFEQGTIKPDMQLSDVPREPRNLSARPSRPRTIEGTATEVHPAPLPIPETPQPSQSRPSTSKPEPVPHPEVAQFKELTSEITRLQAENAHMQEKLSLKFTQTYPEPEIEVQPVGSGETATFELSRTRHDANFWQLLMLILGEWDELGSLLGLVPTNDTLKILGQFKLDQFINDLDLLRDEMQEMRETQGVGNAA